MERLNAFTLLKSVDNGKLFQALIILHAIYRTAPFPMILNDPYPQ